MTPKEKAQAVEEALVGKHASRRAQVSGGPKPRDTGMEVWCGQVFPIDSPAVVNTWIETTCQDCLGSGPRWVKEAFRPQGLNKHPSRS